MKIMSSTFPWRSVILSATGLCLIGAFTYYLYANSDKYLELLQVSSWLVASLVFITLMGMFINGLLNTSLLQSLGTNLSHREGFILAAASTLANQLPISGGMISRGYYLKLKHNLSYATFISISLALFVCFIAVNGFIGLGILIYRLLFERISLSPFLWTGFALMSTCILLFWLPLDWIKVPDRFLKHISQAIGGWMFIGRNPLVAVKLVGLQTLMMLMLAARYYIAFHMLSQNASTADALLFASASVLTQLIGIAPGGLGVAEAIVAAVASALGFDIGASVAAVALDRLVSTTVIIVVGGISTIILGKQISTDSLSVSNPK